MEITKQEEETQVEKNAQKIAMLLAIILTFKAIGIAISLTYKKLKK